MIAMTRSSIATPVKSITIFSCGCRRRKAPIISGGRNEPFGVAPGHHRQIAHGLETGVLPDRADVAARIGRGSGAGRIDQIMPVDAIEVARDDLVQSAENRGRVEQVPNGRIERGSLRRPFLRPYPTEQGHPTLWSLARSARL